MVTFVLLNLRVLATFHSVFRSLLDSDLFTIDTSSNYKRFATFSNRMGYEQRDREYILFGKIFYWYVIVRRCVPFPINLDPAILAFGIYGDDLPITCLDASHPLRQMMETLSGFTNGSLRSDVENTLQPWVEPYCINLDYAVREILDTNRGPKPFIQTLLKNAVFNNANEAFNYFRQGFIGKGERTFISVYHLRRFLT